MGVETGLVQSCKMILAHMENRFPYAFVPLSIEDNQLFVMGIEIKVYIAATISEAWCKAYPEYRENFREDYNLAKSVDVANGKWLEPKFGKEHLCILLSRDRIKCQNEMEHIFIHELRHCFDFIKTWLAWKNAGNDGIPPCGKEFSLWSEFNAVYTDTVSRLVGTDRAMAFEKLSSYLGYKTADCVNGMLTNQNEAEYFEARYLGVQRSIRDLATELCPAPVFHLWHMTPQLIDERSPHAFYKANEWQAIDHF